MKKWVDHVALAEAYLALKAVIDNNALVSVKFDDPKQFIVIFTDIEGLLNYVDQAAGATKVDLDTRYGIKKVEAVHRGIYWMRETPITSMSGGKMYMVLYKVPQIHPTYGKYYGWMTWK